VAEPSHDAEQAASWQQRLHDLRQPLNAIGLFCAALRARPLAPAEQRMVQGISEAAAALEKMVDTWAVGGTPLQHMANSPLALSTLVLDSAAHTPTHPTQDNPVLAARRPRVLIVDDDMASRTSMAMLVEACVPGVEVLDFGHLDTLEDFLGHLPGPPPALCIVDYHLASAGEGLAALSLLRRAWPGHPLTAAILTGDGSAAQALRRAEPALDVILKPTAPEALIALVRRSMQRP
jgi:CheY-like chemotaxis protein